MENLSLERRKFIRKAATTAASIAGLAIISEDYLFAANKLNVKTVVAKSNFIINEAKSRIKFSVIGVNHAHINSLIETITAGGGEFISFYNKEPDLAMAFSKKFPGVKMAQNKSEILEDKSVQIILSAAIPDERASIGIEVMKHGKDFMVDKPGITSLKQLKEVKRVQSETGRIYSIMYSSRFENPATIKAGDLIKEGEIGKVIQTIGLGPHRLSPESRPNWFFQRQQYGGILTDLGSHQFDEFLFFTGSKKAEVIAAQRGNVNHPEYPQLEDFGDALLRGDGGAGYLRVDWFTPKSLKSWGDSRLTILGTEGYIEIRKNVDIATREGGNHLFLVNQKSMKYIDCNNVPLQYGQLLVDDVLNRTETAMTQAHCFLATELALKAQKKAMNLS